MKRQRLVAQGTLARLFKEAAEAWHKQDYAGAITALERASRLDPANSECLLDLGRAYGLRYDYPAAERCLERAARVSSRPGQALAEAGRRCQEFGHYDLAKAFFERGVAAGDLESLITLAELYERHHRLPEAEELLERASRADPRSARARVVQARLWRLNGKFSEAGQLLRALLAEKNTDPSSRIRAQYELAAVLDRLGKFDEAMSALLEAKAAQRPAAAGALKVLAGIQGRVREMEGTITAEVMKRWAESGGTSNPARRLAILCGHPRSGTTLLEQVLDSHPEVVSAEETHILHDEAYLPLSRNFSPETSLLEVLESAPPSLLQQSRDDYFRFTELFLGRSLEGRLLVDKNPALNVLIPAVVRLFPEASFLVAIRDPRDVCLSCFMQPLAINPVSSAYLSLEGTVNQYVSVMGFWKALLPRLPNRWMEVRYEDLVEDLEGAARRVLKFLNLPWSAEVLRFHEHARSKPVRSPSYAEVTRPIHSRAVGRWQAYRSYFDPYQDKLRPYLEAFGYA